MNASARLVLAFFFLGWLIRTSNMQPMDAGHVSCMRIGIILLIGVTGLLQPGCDERSGTVGGSSTSAPAPTNRPPAPTLQTLAQLLPNRKTRVAADAVGNVYWVQDAPPAGSELMFTVGANNVPAATELSTRLIASKLPLAGTASGEIQSIACGSDNAVYFYFNGGVGPNIVVELGRFDPKTNEIQILADTNALSRLTGMDAALALATGTLIPVNDGKQVWLWIRHTDAFVLTRFDMASSASAMKLEKPIVTLGVTQSTTAPAIPISLTDESQRLGPGPNGSLLLLDLPASMLRQIKADGRVSDVASLVGLSDLLSAPAVDLRDGVKPGQLLIFAATSLPLRAHSAEQVVAPTLLMNVQYPAMIVLNPPGQARAVPMTKFDFHAGFQAPATGFQQLVYAGDNSYASYDSGSGELVRIKW